VAHFQTQKSIVLTTNPSLFCSATDISDSSVSQHQQTGALALAGGKDYSSYIIKNGNNYLKL
jgi:transaldolase